jgi:hypothetical protein
VLGTACVVLGACGGGSDESSGTTAANEAITTASNETTTSAAGGSSTTSTASGEDVWGQTASQNRGKDGQRFTVDCPPGGTPRGIWGVETYTDDSSICTAAVHVGLITLDDGGEVAYEIGPGLEEYASATGGGILSSRYTAYPGSFTFPDAPPGSGDFTIGPETWTRTASDYAGEDGKQITVRCAAGGPLASVWGTGTYTSDSSICTAAVHAGLITLDDGGSVTIEMAPGADSYSSTDANGVTSSSYGSFGSSFTFPDDQPDN